MHILLINPNYSEPIQEDGSHTPVIPNFPIGLGYVASYVREYSDHEVEVLDAGKGIVPYLSEDGKTMIYGLTPDKIGQKLEKARPDVIGISGMYGRDALNIHRCAALAKERHPNVPIIVGGSHASLLPEVVIQDENIDFVCMGEGEITFLEFCNVIDRSEDASKLLGLCYKKDGRVIKNPPRPRIEDLDSIPFPARDLFDFEFYVKHIGREKFLMRQPWAYLISSRGCPFNCSFCNVKFVWTRKWCCRSAENIVSEMTLMKEKYGIREFAFMDDCASVNKKAFMRLLNTIIEAKLDIKFAFPTGLAFTTLDKEVMDKLYEAGCYRVTFGMESGNPEIRKDIRKTWSLDKAKELIKYANHIGMWTANTNIIGPLNETREQMEDTLQFNIESNVDLATFYLLATHPASDVYRQFEEAGIVPKIRKPKNGDDVLRYYKDISPIINDVIGAAPQRNKHFTGIQLGVIQGEFYRRFLKHRLKALLKNPLHLLKKIRNFESLKYTLNLGMTYSKMLTYSFFHKNKKDMTRHLFSKGHKNEQESLS